ncbi:MAG: hypothetical protein KDN22_27860, partial [Verrucomicrobiae bacterium]|nr:hypothetical protein [Verrucomicrobiae bacterium]
MIQLSLVLGVDAQQTSFPQSGPYVFSFESDPAFAGWTFDKWTWVAVPAGGIAEIGATGTNSQLGHVRPSSSALDDGSFGGAEFPLPPVVPAASHRSLGFGEHWLVNAAAGNATDPGTGLYEQTNSGTATLQLTGLPAHSSVDLGFLLAMGDSFDSGNSSNRDGAFEVIVDGASRFTHVPKSSGNGLVGAKGVQTLATGANLGYAYIEQWEDNGGLGPADENDRKASSWTLDSAYDITAQPALMAIPHTADSLTIEFIHRVSSAPSDEHLAIDNVRVELSTDGDGMPASWETLHGLDPNSDDSASDADLDGRTNQQEFQLGSNPNVSDSPFLHAGMWNVRQIRGI